MSRAATVPVDLNQPVGKGGFAVVDMGHDGEIADEVKARSCAPYNRENQVRKGGCAVWSGERAGESDLRAGGVVRVRGEDGGWRWPALRAWPYFAVAVPRFDALQQPMVALGKTPRSRGAALKNLSRIGIMAVRE